MPIMQFDKVSPGDSTLGPSTNRPFKACLKVRDSNIRVIQEKPEERSEFEIRNEQRVVEVAFEFVNIGEIDTLNEKFQADVNIESKWLIRQLTENEDIFNNYDPSKHWNPLLQIENKIVTKEEITYESSEENGQFYMTEFRQVKGFFWSKLDLKNFPVDVQELEIVVTSKYGSEKLTLVDDRNKISYILFDATQTFRDQQKWKLFRLITTSSKANYEEHFTRRLKIKKREKDLFNDIIKAREKFKPSKIVAQCYTSRRPGFYIMNAFFLVFLITTMTLATFAIDVKLPHFRLQSIYVILLTSVSFKWVVNRSLPPVSYLTSLDAYQISCIFFICCLATWHALVGDKDLMSVETSMNTDKWLLGIFAIVWFLLNNAFFLWMYLAYAKVRGIKNEEEKYFEKNRQHFLPLELKHSRRKSIFPTF